MPSVNDSFPSRYLKAADLKGRTVEVEIMRVDLEEVGNEEKLCAYFAGKEKGLVLNKTNATLIADSYGDDTDRWQGKKIILYPDKTQFNGRIVPCLRVRLPERPLPPEAEGDGEIPF